MGDGSKRDFRLKIYFFPVSPSTHPSSHPPTYPTPHSLLPSPISNMKTLTELLDRLRVLKIAIWLEDDKLRYRAPNGVMTPELLDRLKAQKPEIIDFLQQLRRDANSSRPPLIPIDRDRPIPLSFAQQRFWLLHQFEPTSSANNMPVVLHLTGKLDILAWERSLTEIVRRHEILRTTFPLVDGQPHQAIAQNVTVTLPIADLRHLPADLRDKAALEVATTVARQPFNFDSELMLHVKLIQLQDEEYLFIWCLHCITGDGSSSDIFYRELTTIYAAFSQGKPSPLPELPIQYADFAQWQRSWLQGEVLESQLQYWKQQLSGSLTAIPLPTDFDRPPVQTYRGDRCPRMFSNRLHGELVDLAHRSGASLFMILLAAFETLLYRYSGREDLLISFTNAGRDRLELENLIGFFSGTLLLRTNFAGNPSFRSILDRVKHEALEAHAHQDLPFEKLLEELQLEPTGQRSPLFQTKFALNPPWTNGRGMFTVQLPDLEIESLFGYIYHGQTKFDLTLVMREQVQGLGAVFDYNADIFDARTANRMMEHFELLLEAIVIDPDRPILDLPILDAPERQQLLAPAIEPPPLCLHELVEQRSSQNPTQIAICCEDRLFTYEELNHQADLFAHYLDSQELRLGDLIALWIEPSLDLAVAILGILKLGGTYVPIDPSAPIEGQLDRLQQLGVSLILIREASIDRLQTASIRSIGLAPNLTGIAAYAGESLVAKVAPTNLAIVVDPSGSSEKLTTIALTHAQLVGNSQSLVTAWALTSDDRLLLSASSIASSTIEELFACWSCGATAILPSDRQPQAMVDLLEWIDRRQVSVLNLADRAWQEWSKAPTVLKHNLPACLRLVTVVGMASTSTAAYQQWRELVGAAPHWIYRHRSIATTTTLAIYDPGADAADLRGRSILPIGRPLANLKTYILDPQLQLLPIGVPGDLYLDWHPIDRADPIAAQLVPHPFRPNAQLLKTGDLARYLLDGNLELRTETDSTQTTRPIVQQQPLGATETDADEIERQLIEIWQNLFNLESIGLDDNFFELGGYSLLAVSLFAKIDQKLGKNLPLSVLLKAPTIRQLANLLREPIAAAAWSPLVAIQTGTADRPPLFCMHGGGFNVLIYRDLALNLGAEQTVYGLQARELDGSSPIRDRLEDIAADYIQQIQTIQPQGPYLLCGLSNGGNIALEMAQQLQQQGQQIGLLAMFDTYASGGAKLLPTLPRLLSSLSYAAVYSLPRIKTKFQHTGLQGIGTEIQTKLQDRRLGLDRDRHDRVPTSVCNEMPAPHSENPVQIFDRQLNSISQYILEHSPWAFFQPTAQLAAVDGSLSTTLKNLEVSYQKIHKAYQPKPYVGAITLFKAMEKPPGYFIDPYLGWGEIAIKGIEVHKIPGHHTSLLTSKILAEKMKACIVGAASEYEHRATNNLPS